MKLVHNIRVRVHNHSREIVEAVLQKADAMARKDEKDVIERTLQEDEGLWIGELWLDHQGPARRFLTAFLTSMDDATKDAVRANPGKHLDTATHAYFHCDRDSFVAGKTVLAAASGSVAVRLNIAAFPATKENALLLVQELFSKN